MGRSLILFSMLFLLVCSPPLIVGDVRGLSTVSSSSNDTTRPSTKQSVNHFPIIIEREVDFSDLGLSGDGSAENPYVIENLIITAGGYCVFIEDTSVHFVIRNCYLRSSGFQVVHLRNTANGIIENCEIVGGEVGVSLDYVYGCTVRNNSIHDCNNGISLGIVYDCPILDNDIFRNHIGIEVHGYSTDSGCLVTGNSVFGNFRKGVDLFDYSENNTFFDNSIGWNGGPPSVFPLINADDDGSYNYWDDNISRGNRWSDWNGLGVYQVQGAANSIDHYPALLTDDDEPSIAGPEDLQFRQGTTGNTLCWNAQDRFPSTYCIVMDDVVTENESWTGNSIEMNLDSLEPGSYNFTLVVSDIIGQSASDQVFVEVLSADVILLNVPQVLAIVGFACIVIVILYFKKMR